MLLLSNLKIKVVDRSNQLKKHCTYNNKKTLMFALHRKLSIVIFASFFILRIKLRKKTFLRHY